MANIVGTSESKINANQKTNSYKTGHDESWIRFMCF